MARGVAAKSPRGKFRNTFLIIEPSACRPCPNPAGYRPRHSRERRYASFARDCFQSPKAIATHYGFELSIAQGDRYDLLLPLHGMEGDALLHVLGNIVEVLLVPLGNDDLA